MKKIISLIAMLCLTAVMQAQMVDPVHFSSQLKMLGGDQAEIVFTATIDKGWHLYSTELGSDGPISASFHANKMDGAETVGKLTPRGKEVKQFDNMFGMELRFFEGSATFVQKIRFTKPNYDIDCYLEYGACNDEMCLPPSQVALVKKGSAPTFAATKIEKPAERQRSKPQQLPTPLQPRLTRPRPTPLPPPPHCRRLTAKSYGSR